MNPITVQSLFQQIWSEQEGKPLLLQLPEAIILHGSHMRCSRRCLRCGGRNNNHRVLGCFVLLAKFHKVNVASIISRLNIRVRLVFRA